MDRSNGLAPDDDPAPSTERRPITVVFCDLVDSTALAEEVDPEDLTEIVRAFHRAITRTMTERGGFVARYMGDGALVYFGYPQAQEDDAEQAVHAALETIDAVAALELQGGRRLRAHIGIATGVVVVGDLVGMGRAHGPDVAGATPNLAARLQSLAPPDMIYVAESTRRLAGDAFEWRDAGLHALKGLAEPVRAWQVTGARAVPSRFDAQHANLRLPMIGRERERLQLLELWADAKRGNGQVALISGEPGIGKSRLAAELMRDLQDEPHTRLRYFCSPHREHSPLHPCIAQLEHLAGFARTDTPAQKLDKLEAALADTPPHDLQLIADLLLLPTADRYPVPQFAPQKKRERVLQALADLLERASRLHPLLAIFEDAQWCDESSRELLALVAGRVAAQPMLLVVTARPEFDPPWPPQPNVARIALSQLRSDESAELIGRIAGGASLDRRIVDDIIARTDGVPLFVEEITRAVVEQDDAGAVPASRGQPGLPTTLQASLLARLDRLGGAREIAEVAAAIGRDFTVELLTLVVNRSRDAIVAALDRLVESALVVPRASFGPGYMGYSFRHALIRDAAYGIMVRERRRPLHARIAQAIEAHFPERAAAQPDVLAQHCSEGGLIDKAVGYWLAAGQQALRRSAMSEALVHLRRGLELLRLLPDDDARRRRELDLAIALGKAQIATQGYAVASTGETFARARALCAELGDPPQLLSVTHGLWTHALLRAEMDSAKRQALELLRRGEERRDPLWLLMGCRFSGVTHHPLGEFERACAFLERGIALYDPAQFASYALITVDDPKVVMLTYLSWSLMCRGEFDAASRASAQALEFARQLSHVYTLAHALNGSSFVALTIGSAQTALERLDELMPLLDEHGIAYYGAVGLLFRGWCLASLGQHDEVEPLLRHGMAAYRATGSVLFLPGFLRMAAEAYARIGSSDAAWQSIREAKSVMQATGQRWDEAEIHRVHAQLLVARGEHDAARSELGRALAIAQEQRAGLWELRACADLARLTAEQGSHEDARRVLAPICERFTASCAAPDVIAARSLLRELRA